MRELKGKRIFIVGASGGLGEAMTRAFAESGARLVVHGSSNAGALTQLRALPDVELALHADVRREDEVASAFAQVSSLWDGGLDALVYAAGVNPTAARLRDITLADWDITQSVNLRGAFLAIKHALPLFDVAGHGKIVLISSMFALETPANRSAYGAAKHGLTGLVQSVAKEEGKHVHINALCPGGAWGKNVQHIFAETAKTRGITVEEYTKERLSQIPAGRLLEPEELAHTAMFFCSSLSDYINGETIRLSGGAR